ncbi:DUF6415 family natural product biosynthesis protein [Streptomyces sp. NBC_00536]|uniref:DUF6415 family natural product biosynthesis protein n=1 Tax=Streptomyces sp. NBC_00536 TaxID=2975769 RepID=UPI002E809E80|nr:DUF6415 family natural product biosynthesis protein [Streptomyces sp. NBC_00536]WUC83467.1 DUF6415 family natural product biosynthesis protein [Streptomyces sp. NBC_00536]
MSGIAQDPSSLKGGFDASVETLQRVLAALDHPIHASTLNGILDDVDAALGDGPVPDDQEIHALALRLRGHLMRLLAVIPEHEQDPDQIAALAGPGQRLLNREVPGDCMGTRKLLRAMALAALALLDLFSPLPVPAN